MVNCETCLDTGMVCENHSNRPWETLEAGTRWSTCCGGAGMPCPKCCSEIPQDGSTSITQAFVPDWQRAW